MCRRSVTLVGEGDRKMLKAVIKHSSDQDNVRHRVLPADLVSQWATELDSLKDEVSEIMQEEKQEKQVCCIPLVLVHELKRHRCEMLNETSRRVRILLNTGMRSCLGQLAHGSNPRRIKPIHKVNPLFLLRSIVLKCCIAISKRQYEDGSKITDSKSTRPSNKNVQKVGGVINVTTLLIIIFFQPKRDKLSGLTRRAKRRKLALMEDNEAGTSAAVSAAIRAAKKGQRPVKIGEAQPSSTSSKRARSKSKKSSTRKPGFERDLGQPAAREGARARKGDAIGSGKRKDLKKRH
jgi:ATP-dependent RNA helicase DDX27